MVLIEDARGINVRGLDACNTCTYIYIYVRFFFFFFLVFFSFRFGGGPV